VLYSVRTERMLMEQLDYSLLFRWFVGPNMDDPIWDVTVFTKNRQRLLAGNIADAFFAVLKQARRRDLLSMSISPWMELSRKLPPCSIIRPTETKGIAKGVVNFLTAMGLFIGQPPTFFDLLMDLAEDADKARRGR
jgi:hypothetical protein